MACTVVFTGGEKLTFDLEPQEFERLLAATAPGPNGLVRLDREKGPVFVNPAQILFIRALDYGEVPSS